MLANCLNATATNGVTYTAAAIDTCVVAQNTTEQHLAVCLSKAGQIVQDHRSAKQTDLESCQAAVGSAAIATCLGRRGLRNGMVQSAIDQCLMTDGLPTLEKCLRRGGAIPRRPGLFQSDVALCEKVAGNTAALAKCLFDADLVAATVTQAIVDGCITAVGVTRVARCLRINFHVSRALMQAHINECNTAVGQAALATCLDNQGLLPVDPATQLAGFQTTINTCVTNVGIGSVARCLRNQGLLSPQIMQPHIQACFDGVGINGAFNCLSANFATLPTGFTQVELAACFTANNNTAANAARCMATKRILLSAPTQDHVNACVRFAGVMPDATRPGAVGIGECLNRSGLLPAPLNQAEINTCITNGMGQTTNVATCLHNRGIVPSFARFNAAGGLFAANCTSCHGNAGGLTIGNYASITQRIVKGNSAGSMLYMRVNGGGMPPAGPLPAGSLQAIARWIDQGGNNN